MTGVKKIPISHVYSMEDSKSNEYLVGETLLQVCFTEKDKSKIIIVDESSTEASESECVHKIANKVKYANKRQSTRNLWLRMIQLSRSQAILSY